MVSVKGTEFIRHAEDSAVAEPERRFINQQDRRVRLA